MSTLVRFARMRMTGTRERRSWIRGIGAERFGVITALAIIASALNATEGIGQAPPEEPVNVEERAVDPGEWVGKWSGPFMFEGDGPFGSMILSIAHNGEEWRVSSELVAEGAPVGGEVREWVVRGDRFSYSQWFDAIDVRVRGGLVEGELVGDIEAWNETERMGVGTFRIQEVALSPVPANDP